MQYCFILLIYCWSLSLGSAQQCDTALWRQYREDKQLFEAFESRHRAYVQTANIDLSYLRWGDSTHKAFVWIPGSLLSAYDFAPFAESLVQEGYFVLSVDHYGHGMTGIPDHDADFSDFADDLSQLLAKYDIASAVIGGFSRGGYLASAFYHKYAHLVDALILEDGGSAPFTSAFSNMPSDRLEAFLQTVKLPKDIEQQYFDRYDSEFELYCNFYDHQAEGSQFQNFGFIRRQGEKWIGYYGLNEYMSMQDCVHYARVLFQPELVSRYAASISQQNPMEIYAHLDVPMLIMEATGEPDPFDNSQGNGLLYTMFPKLITYKIFSCANHNIHYDCPNEFLETIIDFLRE